MKQMHKKANRTATDKNHVVVRFFMQLLERKIAVTQYLSLIFYFISLLHMLNSFSSKAPVHNNVRHL